MPHLLHRNVSLPRYSDKRLSIDPKTGATVYQPPEADWKVADGWATEAEANDHAERLREAHPEAEVRVRKGEPFGAGPYRVEYRNRG